MYTGTSHHHDEEDHDHDDEGPQGGEEKSLFQQIDLNGVRCYNTTSLTPSTIFRPWDKRFETQDSLESDADEQMILFVPFLSSIKLKSIGLLGPNDEQAPSSLQVYIILS
jgi:hypothetical protein